ncbi:hypothetical protein QE152_g980 [Popillia japonica]|uniref:Uncharacterized protein n=1 Tax=Popillia japonica TaxID=7064 RepID=A0AAW1N4A1_POPJA
MRSRKQVLPSILANVRSSRLAGNLAKKNSVLDAIRWVDQSVKNIKPNCVKECFAACGITHDRDTEVNENVEEIAEDTNEIEELVTEINPRCNVHDCITLDESVTTNAGLQSIDELVMEKTAAEAGTEILLVVLVFNKNKKTTSLNRHVEQIIICYYDAHMYICNYVR